MSTVAPNSTFPYRGDPNYPMSDGTPMAETGIHVELMFGLLGTLNLRLADEPMAYAGANMFLYYVEGDMQQVVSPDVFVTLGVPKEPQRVNYIVWQEGKPPDVIIELTSKSTKNVDRTKKKKLYQDVLRIPEYFLFDPTEDYLKPSLQGYRLVEGAYAPIPLVGGRMRCDVLGLDLGPEGKMLRLYDATTGAKLPTQFENALQARREANLARTRANHQKRQAEQERERADQAGQLAEQERERADQASQLADQASQLAEQERERAEQASQLAERERERAEQISRLAEQERERAEQASHLAEQTSQLIERERERAEQADQRAMAVSAENQRLLREIQELRRKLGGS